jgi:diguanylate cyclase (GGDEF)-like protein
VQGPACPDDALDDCPVAVVSVGPDGCVRRWNAACSGLLGIAASTALGGRLEAVLSLEPRDRTGRFRERHWAVTADRRVPVELTTWTSGSDGAALVHHWLGDSTAKVAHEDQLERAVAVLRRQARSDALTGLANRFELGERLAAALADAAARAALVVVDLDDFKPINDVHGHGVGDEVLTSVAARLTASVRVEDTVARVGGDEFIVLARLPVDARPLELIGRVSAAFADPLTTSVGSLRITASIGVAVSDDGQEAEELIRRADRAMYRAKLSRPASALVR